MKNPCFWKSLLLQGRYKNDKRARRKHLSERLENRIHNLFDWLENGIESGLMSKKELANLHFPESRSMSIA